MRAGRGGPLTFRARPGLDLGTAVGSVGLANPVMTASGTAGHGTELAPYIRLADLGAVVVKSLADVAWPGNPAPRLHPVTGGMLNSVGLQGPGVAHWVDHDLPALTASGCRVVASIWATTVAGYERAAALLTPVADRLAALEVNVSCPNVEDRRRMFAHSPSATAEAIQAAGVAGVPRWAKLSPNVTDLISVADAALSAGAEALTLINTVMGMVIDVDARRPALGGGGGGLSGPAVHPVAVRAVYECRAAFPDAGIVGVGGVDSGPAAVELLLAGADAVQVGTATFADPAAPLRILADLDRWARRRGVRSVRDLVGAAQPG